MGSYEDAKRMCFFSWSTINVNAFVSTASYQQNMQVIWISVLHNSLPRPSTVIAQVSSNPDHDSFTILRLKAYRYRFLSITIWLLMGETSNNTATQLDIIAFNCFNAAYICRCCSIRSKQINNIIASWWLFGRSTGILSYLIISQIFPFYTSPHMTV